jgi:glycosyltransferase involved in cell wall biosynthesis
MARPLVTFVVAAHNAEATIESALRSLVWQNVKDWEALVVDDGSSDGTAERAAAVGDPRISIERLPGNVGRAAARNIAVERARGRFIAIQDADDISHPKRLETLLDLVSVDSRIGVASGQHASFVREGTYWSSMRWPTGDAAIRAGLERGEMTVCHAGALLSTQLLLDLGGYDERCLRAQDLNFLIRALPHTRFAASQRVVVYYRHPRVVSFRYWRERCRFHDLAVQRARPGLRPRPGVSRIPTVVASYARYALRESLVRPIEVPGPSRGCEAPLNAWSR